MVQEFPSTKLDMTGTSSSSNLTTTVASSSSISATSLTNEHEAISSLWSTPATVSNHLVELQKEIKEEEEEIFADLNSLINRSYLFPNVCAEDSYQDSLNEDGPINRDDYENRMTFNNHRPQLIQISKPNDPVSGPHSTTQLHDVGGSAENNSFNKNHEDFSNLQSRNSLCTTIKPNQDHGFTVTEFETADSTTGLKQRSNKPPSSLGSPTITTTSARTSNLLPRATRYQTDFKDDFQDDSDEPITTSRSKLADKYHSECEDTNDYDRFINHRVTYERSNNNNNNNVDNSPMRKDVDLASDELLPATEGESYHQNDQEYQAIIHRITNNQPKPCVFFLEGNCRRSDCKYSHDLSNIVCKYWIEGFCFKGEMCPFLHSYDAGADATGSISDDDSISKKNLNPTFTIESEADFPSLPFEGPASSPGNNAKSQLKLEVIASSMKNRILSSNPAVVFKTAKKKRKKG